VLQISSDRTGFIKSKSPRSTVYATLDTNILCTRLQSPSALTFDSDDEELVTLQGHKFVFPHAVLKIRWEGDPPRWLEELNASYLIERVNNFSMYVHAISVLLPSKVHTLPHWVPLSARARG
jgi:VTC domain